MLICGRSGASPILRTSQLNLHIVNCICIYKRDKLKSKIQSSAVEPDRPQHDHPNACYRPAVFFRPHPLTAFSFLGGKKFDALFKTNRYLIFCLRFQNFISRGDRIKMAWKGNMYPHYLSIMRSFNVLKVKKFIKFSLDSQHK